MSKFKKIKDFFREKFNNQQNNSFIEENNNSFDSDIMFGEIVKKINQLSKYRTEIDAIKPHKHYFVKELEDEIFPILDEHPELIKETDGDGRNLAMILCNYGELEDFILKVLNMTDDEYLEYKDGREENIFDYLINKRYFNILDKVLDCDRFATKQFGSMKTNLGMQIAASFMYEKNKESVERLIIKALKNPIASVQQDYDGWNIGMYAAKRNFEKATLFALDNKEASMQQEKKSGKTIAIIGTIAGMQTVAMKGLENKESALLQTEKNVILPMFAAIKKMEDVALKALDDNDFALHQDVYGRSLGMLCAEENLAKATLKALDNPEASLQQNTCGLNIGMYAAGSRLEKCLMKALDNPIASLQQDEEGYNMGMLAALYQMEEPTLKALENKQACLQQDEEGWNIGMYCVFSLLVPAIKESLKNQESVLQINDDGDDIFQMIMESELSENEKIELLTLGNRLDLLEFKNKQNQDSIILDNDNNIEVFDNNDKFESCM